MRILLHWVLIWIPLLVQADIHLPDTFRDLPVLYNGRYRPAEAAARLWLADLSGKESLPDEEALSFAWRVHVFGHQIADDKPLFIVQSLAVKQELGLDVKRQRFSFLELQPLLQYESDSTLEVQDLQLKLSRWQRLGEEIQQIRELQQEAIRQMTAAGIEPEQIRRNLQQQLPLTALLQQAGSLFPMLPLRFQPEEWVSLSTFLASTYNSKSNELEPVGNFTPYTRKLFEELREHYQSARKATIQQTNTNDALLLFTSRLTDAYAQLKQQQSGLPSPTQLKAERWYYQWHPCLWLLLLYLCAAITFLFHRHTAIFLLFTAFSAHTALIAARTYILNRPPVSNMFETVVYVPWIAVFLALLFVVTRPRASALIPASAAFLAVALLALVETTQIQRGMEPLQPVLNSQYWLIIHVLMIVASYGVFLLAGILGHAYLGLQAWGKRSAQQQDDLATSVLYSLYLGTGLLIPGTILGGVWAAQSWGRFWDWDPKESWAFISSCVYLVVIHAHTFRHIKARGLAIGSIIGLWAISFTWYGVNYILGTGLHSYGFGSGGSIYYYSFLATDMLFVGVALYMAAAKKNKKTATISFTKS